MHAQVCVCKRRHRFKCVCAKISSQGVDSIKKKKKTEALPSYYIGPGAVLIRYMYGNLLQSWYEGDSKAEKG